MRSRPGQAGDHSVARREELVHLVVPIGERRPHALDVALERFASVLDRAKRAPEVEVLGQDLVGDLEPPLVPELVVEAADESLARRGLRYSSNRPSKSPNTAP